MIIIKERQIKKECLNDLDKHQLKIWDRVVMCDEKHLDIGVGLVMGFYENDLVCVMFGINNPSLTFVVHKDKLEKV